MLEINFKTKAGYLETTEKFRTHEVLYDAHGRKSTDKDTYMQNLPECVLTWKDFKCEISYVSGPGYYIGRFEEGKNITYETIDTRRYEQFVNAEKNPKITILKTDGKGIGRPEENPKIVIDMKKHAKFVAGIRQETNSPKKITKQWTISAA